MDEALAGQGEKVNNFSIDRFLRAASVHFGLDPFVVSQYIKNKFTSLHLGLDRICLIDLT
jgi:hypothetical protein